MNICNTTSTDREVIPVVGVTSKPHRDRVSQLYGILGVVIVAAGLVAGLPSEPPARHRQMIDVLLTGSPDADSLGGGIALIMGPSGIPTPKADYIDAVERVYLDPNGFTGNAIALTTPEETCTCTDSSVSEGATDLVKAVNAQMATGDVSAANPIVVFGYSQSTAVAAEAAERLHDQAVPVPAADLHFVLVGDSASAHGGMLNALLPSLPDWMSSLVKPLLWLFDLSHTMGQGLTTPDYYPTDVYTIPGDGYVDWPTNIFAHPFADLTALVGLFFNHEQYLGLTPTLIQDAVLTNTDGLVDYYTIPDSEIEPIPALLNAAIAADYITPGEESFILDITNWLGITDLPLDEWI